MRHDPLAPAANAVARYEAALSDAKADKFRLDRWHGPHILASLASHVSHALHIAGEELGAKTSHPIKRPRDAHLTSNKHDEGKSFLLAHNRGLIGDHERNVERAKKELARLKGL